MSDTKRSISWFTLAMMLVIAAGFALRHGTNVLNIDNVRDEYKMKVPIDNIVEKGWSIDTAINYQEVKGPAFFWPYAAGGQLLGHDIYNLRLISLLFFIGGAIPLLLIAMRCGVNGWTLIVVALMYALLPYNAMTSQLLFSEPSFNFFGLWMLWAFVRNIQTFKHPNVHIRPDSLNAWMIGRLIVFTILLAILLHHRPQAIALAMAVVLVAFERDGVRAWPWILACIIAGLLRIPLWLHWGGLVTSEYQGLFGFGFRLETLTYLLAAMTPMIAIFLWPALTDERCRSRRWWLWIGGAIGLAIGQFFTPDLAAKSVYHMEAAGAMQSQPYYMGTVATGVKTLLSASLTQHIAIVLLAGLGGISLAAMAIISWNRSALDADGVTCRLAFWMLAAGAPLYIITSGPVYDRYLAVWIVLLPVVWYLSLPRNAIVVQALIAAAMLAYMVNEYLM